VTQKRTVKTSVVLKNAGRQNTRNQVLTKFTLIQKWEKLRFCLNRTSFMLFSLKLYGTSMYNCNFSSLFSSYLEFQILFCPTSS